MKSSVSIRAIFQSDGARKHSHTCPWQSSKIKMKTGYYGQKPYEFFFQALKIKKKKIISKFTMKTKANEISQL